MDLIIAEKPSVARAIADAIGGVTRRDGYLEAGGYMLTWALGHLADHARPEQIDPALEHWHMESLPILPAEWRVVARPGRDYADRLKTIKSLAGKVNGLINACDAGREGELIFRWTMQVLGLTRKPVRRLWLSSLTPGEIRNALAALKPANQYDNLYAGAEVRARADWLTGINATRSFTLRFGASGQGVLSVGRVQTPTLALLVRREQEITGFKPQDYWEVAAHLEERGAQFKARWEDGEDNPQMPTAEAAQAIAEAIRAARTATVAEAETKEVVEAPPQLYDLTALQLEANRRFGLTAAATLEAAQALYESGLLTYPRTDSRHVTQALAATFPALLGALVAMPAYSGLGGSVDATLAQASRRVVDDTKVTDHHAILPTSKLPGALEGDQARVCALVVRRFLANCLPPARDKQIRLDLDADGQHLVARGRAEIDPGWRRAEAPAAAEDEDGEAVLPVPALTVGNVARVIEAETQAKQTKPPRRFTEGTLLGAMESAGRDLGDEAAREAMREHGLGTPATRAAIIERLKAVGYVKPEKKVLVPTEKGVRLIGLVERAGAPVLTSAELTGSWESRIADVERGRAQAGALESDVRQFVADLVGRVKAAPAERGAAEAWPPCPLCGSPLAGERYELRCTRPGCTLRVSRRLLGRDLSNSELTDLLTKRKTPILRGFVSARTRKRFEASLALKPDGSGVSFDFSGVNNKSAPAKGGDRRKHAHGREK